MNIKPKSVKKVCWMNYDKNTIYWHTCVVFPVSLNSSFLRMRNYKFSTSNGDKVEMVRFPGTFIESVKWYLAEFENMPDNIIIKRGKEEYRAIPQEIVHVERSGSENIIGYDYKLVRLR